MAGAAPSWCSLYSLILVLVSRSTRLGTPHESVAEEQAHGGDVRYQELPMGRILGICLVTVFGSLMFYTPITQNANAFVSLGVHSPAQIGQLSSFASFGVPIGAALFWLIGHMRTQWLLLASFVLLTVGFTLMGRADSPMSYVWAANIQQVGCGLILPTMLVWATSGLAYGIRGRAVGFWQGAYAIGLFASGATLTFLAKTLGNGNQLVGLLPAFGRLAIPCAIAAVVSLAVGAFGRRVDSRAPGAA